jgi:hypothetical protein
MRIHNIWYLQAFLIPHTLQQTETNITHNFSGHRNCCVAPYILHTGSTLSQLDQLLQIGPRAGVIYYRVFKYTQQHTPIGSIPPNWVLHWSYLLWTVQVHTITHCRFYRDQHWPPHLIRLALHVDELSSARI